MEAQSLPYGAVRAACPKRREWLAKAAVVAGIAVVALACVGLLVKEKLGGSDGEGADELGGQYYAVAKPPAFNFNRKLILARCVHVLGKTWVYTCVLSLFLLLFRASRTRVDC